SNVVLPVDAGNAVIPNLGWDATRSRLVDATTQAPLTVDKGTRTLRYASGAAFQSGAGNAAITLQAFSTASATAAGPAPFWGVPLDANGQPVANLMMRPDVAPAGAFIDAGGNALSIDGTLGNSNSGTGKPKGVNGSIYYKV